MANITSIKIPELSELSQEEFTGAEYLVLDTGTATKKMQVSDFNRASTETATAKANASAQSATDAAESALNAQNAAQSASDAIANARAQITQDVIDARNAKSNAESCANTARNLVNSDYALTARSYATGDAEDALGHEYREGQSTDNAKYYSEQCAAHDSAAATSETNAKASENNAKASELAAANSAESAAASAQQALENAAGAKEFSGSDPGLVPRSTKTGAFLRSDGQWAEDVATQDYVKNKMSYVGMIIHSTTFDTESKVKEFYGGTTWILHDGYMLRGSASNVLADSANADGGQNTVTPSGTISGGAVQSHTLTVNEMPSHTHGLYYGGTILCVGTNSPEVSSGLNSGSLWKDERSQNLMNTGGGQGHTHSFTQPKFTGTAHTNLPSYKNVYIWERTE